MKNRSQISVFLILGLVLVIVFVLFLSLLNISQSSVNIRQSSESFNQMLLKNYMDTCLLNTFSDTVVQIGYSDTDFLSERIPYNINHCLDSFDALDYLSFSYSDITSDIILTDDNSNLLLLARMPLKLKSDRSEVTASEFYLNYKMFMEQNILSDPLTGEILYDTTISSPDSVFNLFIPAGVTALKSDNTPVESISLEIKNNIDYPALLNSNEVLVGALYYKIQPSGVTFDDNVSLVVKYDSFILPDIVNENDLFILVVDEVSNTVQRLDTIVDLDNKVLYANLTHFSSFAIASYYVHSNGRDYLNCAAFGPQFICGDSETFSSDCNFNNIRKPLPGCQVLGKPFAYGYCMNCNNPSSCSDHSQCILPGSYCQNGVCVTPEEYCSDYVIDEILDEDYFSTEDRNGVGFAGMYSVKRNTDDCIYSNPATNGCSCPRDYKDYRMLGADAVAGSGTTVYDNDVYICYNPNLPGLYEFGGFFGKGLHCPNHEPGITCGPCSLQDYNNPLTQEYKCPKDFIQRKIRGDSSAKDIRGFDVDLELWYCFAELDFSKETLHSIKGGGSLANIARGGVFENFVAGNNCPSDTYVMYSPGGCNLDNSMAFCMSQYNPSRNPFEENILNFDIKPFVDYLYIDLDSVNDGWYYSHLFNNWIWFVPNSDKESVWFVMNELGESFWYWTNLEHLELNSIYNASNEKWIDLNLYKVRNYILGFSDIIPHFPDYVRSYGYALKIRALSYNEGWYYSNLFNDWIYVSDDSSSSSITFLLNDIWYWMDINNRNQNQMINLDDESIVSLSDYEHTFLDISEIDIVPDSEIINSETRYARVSSFSSNNPSIKYFGNYLGIQDNMDNSNWYISDSFDGWVYVSEDSTSSEIWFLANDEWYWTSLDLIKTGYLYNLNLDEFILIPNYFDYLLNSFGEYRVDEDGWYYLSILDKLVWFNLDSSDEGIWFTSGNNWYWTTLNHFSNHKILYNKGLNSWVSYQSGYPEVLSSQPSHLDHNDDMLVEFEILDYITLFGEYDLGDDRWYYIFDLSAWIWFSYQSNPENIWFTDGDNWYWTNYALLEHKIVYNKGLDQFIKLNDNLYHFDLLDDNYNIYDGFLNSLFKEIFDVLYDDEYRDGWYFSNIFGDWIWILPGSAVDDIWFVLGDTWYWTSYELLADNILFDSDRGLWIKFRVSLNDYDIVGGDCADYPGTQCKQILGSENGYCCPSQMCATDSGCFESGSIFDNQLCRNGRWVDVDDGFVVCSELYGDDYTCGSFDSWIEECDEQGNIVRAGPNINCISDTGVGSHCYTCSASEEEFIDCSVYSQEYNKEFFCGTNNDFILECKGIGIRHDSNPGCDTDGRGYGSCMSCDDVVEIHFANEVISYSSENSSDYRAELVLGRPKANFGEWETNTIWCKESVRVHGDIHVSFAHPIFATRLDVYFGGRNNEHLAIEQVLVQYSDLLWSDKLLTGRIMTPFRHHQYFNNNIFSLPSISSDKSIIGVYIKVPKGYASCIDAIGLHGKIDTRPVFDSEVLPLYRLYHYEIGNHFYTINEREKNNAVDNLGFVYEGIAAYIYQTQEKESLPLYRLYHYEIGNHFYTINEREKNNAVDNLGFVYEGIAGYIYQVQEQGTLPFHRLYHYEIGNHFYTINEREKNNAVDNLGFVYEGIVGYVYSSSSSSGSQKKSSLKVDNSILHDQPLSNPKVITNCQELQDINEDLGGHYILGNDIDCSQTIEWNCYDFRTADPCRGFIPIGLNINSVTGSNDAPNLEAFNGILDGNYYQITGLNIQLWRRNSNTRHGWYGALFGRIGPKGEVRNLHIADANIEVFRHAAILAIFNEGSVSQVATSGRVQARTHWAAGLVSSNSGTILNSYSTASFDGDGSAGLVASNSGSIINSYAIGYNHRGINFQNQQWFGGMPLVFQGIVGSSISNSYYDRVSSGVDYPDQASSSTLERAESLVNFISSGKTTQQLKSKSTFQGWDFEKIWSINEGQSTPYFKNSRIGALQ
ncbi:MAG: hypothetical protein ACMXYG_01360 [Candidatus Woesearchaeota archaeon]